MTLRIKPLQLLPISPQPTLSHALYSDAANEVGAITPATRPDEKSSQTLGRAEERIKQGVSPWFGEDCEP